MGSVGNGNGVNGNGVSNGVSNGVRSVMGS